MTNPVAIRSLRAFCYRYPLQTPVETSFGRMLDRPAVFIRIEDNDGHVGWGEAWSNFPSVGAEHRARIINEIIAPAVTGFVANTPHDLFDHLSATYAVLALQTGEHGPFAQSIAGIDIAMWDLAARRQAQPLWRLLERPALIGVGGDQVVARKRAQRGEIGDVALGAETDLQFQRAVAGAQRRFRRSLRAGRIDAAGIDVDAGRVAAEQAP